MDSVIDERPQFVWTSTEDSVEQNIPSVLAASETAISAIGYWAIAIYFETTAHLWLSICVAPLLLMRSDSSVAAGVRWFDRYCNATSNAKEPSKATLWMMFGAFAPFLFVGTYIVSHFWLFDLNGALLIWGAFLANILILELTAMLLVAVFSINAPVIGNLIGYSCFAVPIFLLLFNGWVAAIGALSSFTIFAFIAFKANGWTAPSFALGAAAGIWLRSLLIRFTATARYIVTGFFSIPANFGHALFVIDLRCPAELVPGYHDVASFRSDGLLKQFREAPDVQAKVTNFMALLVFVAPALIYRLSLKSTCWLYFPLVYIMGPRDFTFDANHLVDRLRRSPWETARRFLAVTFLLSFAGATLFYNISDTKLPLLKHSISPIEYLFVLDYQLWKKPWQVFTILSALITWFLFFQANDILVDLKHAHTAVAKQFVDRRCALLRLLMRTRNVFSAILVLILGLHAVLVLSPVMKFLPRNALSGLKLLYGDYLPVN